MEYYTPNIEDIHIGYECQVSYNHGNTWRDFIIVEEDFQRLRSIYKLRTSYLTKEQIEAEGWKILNDTTLNMELSKCETVFEGYDIKLGEDKITIRAYSADIYSGGGFSTLYVGKCPSINEFRTICKLLGIK